MVLSSTPPLLDPIPICRVGIAEQQSKMDRTFAKAIAPLTIFCGRVEMSEDLSEQRIVATRTRPRRAGQTEPCAQIRGGLAKIDHAVKSS